MKNKSKKRLVLALSMLLALLSLPSCLKKDDTTILINNPQDIPLITGFLPSDLLAQFGEQNVHFGDQPPVIDMEFVSRHEYVSVTTSAPSFPPPGTVSPIAHYHKINQQYLQIAEYLSMSSEEAYCNVISPVYLTGHGNDFTVYYHESPQTDGSPEHAVLFSGTLTADGVKNFMYGYKILRYNDSVVPITAYPVNTIFVFKDRDGLAEKNNWYNDSLVHR